MLSYADRMKEHLGRYRVERLGVDEQGIWRGNRSPYPHILPDRLQHLNVLETVREEFWAFHAARNGALELHSDFHHLNSSQAFAFNLLYPYLADSSRTSDLLAAFGLPDREVRDWAFEKVLDPGEGTCVDACLELAGGGRVLIEVKLTESGFGSCGDDARHRAKRDGTYAPMLHGKVPPERLKDGTFFANYQLFRNVGHLDLGRGDLLVILLPRANDVAWREGEAFIREHLSASARAAVRMIAAEHLVSALSATTEAGEGHLRTHLAMLSEKYLLDFTSAPS